MANFFRVTFISVQRFFADYFYLRYSHVFNRDPEFNLLETLRERLNFRVMLILSKDNTWGSIDENGKWTGMIGQIINNEADFGISYLSLTYDRFQVVNFTKPYFSSRLTFFTKAASYSPPDLNTIIRPFSWKLWLAILISFISVNFFIYYLAKYRAAPKKTPLISDVIWFFFGLIIYQSGELSQSDKTRCRLIIASWLLAIIVLTPTYSGILTSLLALPVPSLIAETVEELNEAVRLGKAKVGTAKTSVYYDILANSKTDNWKYIRESVIKESVSFDYGMKRVLNEDNYVFLSAEEFGVYFAIQNGLDNYFISKDSFVEINSAIAAKKDFVYLNEFNKILSQGGFFDLWYENVREREIYQGRLKVPPKEPKKTDSGFGVMQGPFIILIGGHILATTTFFVEIIFYCLTKKR